VSNRYPWVSFYTARKYFFTPAVEEQGYSARGGIFDTCIKQADFASRKGGAAVDNEVRGCLNRNQFIELMILMARYLL